MTEGGMGLATFRHTRAEFRNFGAMPKADVAAAGKGDARAPAVLPGATLADKSDREILEALGADAGAEAGRAALVEQARALEQSAGRLRGLAQSLHRRSVLAELVKTLDAPDAQADLALAALLVARLDNPDLDPGPYLQQLEDMAREVRGRFENNAPGSVRLEALRKFLFEENGFHGSRTDYYHRANSYLNEVLDDREGLPITLSILFLELARRIGLEGVSGLPLPGHFMVRYAPASGPPQIIDVFDGGRILSRTEAQERVLAATGEGFLEDDLRPATQREIIVRMLRNLHTVAERDGSTEDALHCLDALLALEPSSARERLVRAHLRIRKGDRAGAKEDLQRLIDQAPAGVDVERLAEMLRSL
jgi:regulator of sirC expression with transglutaminase-like and TPR domain